MSLATASGWSLFLSGGPIMWPIALCSVAACAVAVERFTYLRSVMASLPMQVDQVLDRAKRNQIKEAVEFCERSHHPAARVLKAGLMKYDRPRSQIREALEDASIYEIPALEKNLPFLAGIANITPLFGLLGAIAALARSFYVFYHSGPVFETASSRLIADAVWQALIAAMAGLCVAIPAYAAYNYLVSVSKAIVLEMEKASIELVNVLSE